jgi:hypothetical protein
VTLGGPVQVLATSPNYSAIIRPLQWLVIIVIWLFFLRVIRAVWVEVRPAGPRQQRLERRRQERDEGRSRRRKRLRLEVVEPPEYRGVLYDIEDELTIGRGPSCTVSTAYDVYSSSLHARLFRDDDKLWVEDLGSTNGTFVNAEEIARPTRLGKGDLLQIGGTVFEVVK